MKRHLNSLRHALPQVFARFSYVALAGILAIMAFLFAVWFPNAALITAVLGSSSASAVAKLSILLSLLGGIWTNFSLFSASYTVAIAALFGINAAMIVYLLRQKHLTAAGQNLAIGTGGMASGVLGIGCAACGSLTASAALSFFGGAGAIAMLPLNGGEFGILSVALLSISVLLISRSIEQTACSLREERTATARINPFRKSN